MLAIDHDAGFAQSTQTLLDRYGLAGWAAVKVAPLSPLELNGETFHWYHRDMLTGLNAIDLLFIDGPPADRPRPRARLSAGEVLFAQLAPRASVFLNDAGWDGEQSVLSEWRAASPQLHQQTLDTDKGCVRSSPREDASC